MRLLAPFVLLALAVPAVAGDRIAPPVTATGLAPHKCVTCGFDCQCGSGCKCPQAAKGGVREEDGDTKAKATAPVSYTPAGTLQTINGHVYRARGDGWFELVPSVPTYAPVKLPCGVSGGTCPPGR